MLFSEYNHERRQVPWVDESSCSSIQMCAILNTINQFDHNQQHIEQSKTSIVMMIQPLLPMVQMPSFHNTFVSAFEYNFQKN